MWVLLSFHYIVDRTAGRRRGESTSESTLFLLRAVRKAGVREKQKVAHSPDWLSARSSARTRYGSLVSARATASGNRGGAAQAFAESASGNKEEPPGSLLDEQVRDRVVLLVVLGALLAFFLWIGIGSCDNPPARTARRGERGKRSGRWWRTEERRRVSPLAFSAKASAARFERVQCCATDRRCDVPASIDL